MKFGIILLLLDIIKQLDTKSNSYEIKLIKRKLLILFSIR